MDRRRFCRVVVQSGLTLAALSPIAFAWPSKTTRTPTPPQQEQKLEWFRNLKQAHKLAIQSDKPMLIVFGASWCHWCHKMERETLADRRLVAQINRDYVPVHLDFDADNKIAKILEVESLPCVVILSPQADLLSRETGYQDYNKFLKSLHTAQSRRKDIVQTQNREYAR